jgi:hypothetical protein
VTELFPVVAALVAGTLLARAFSGTRSRVLIVLAAVAIGASATVLSGEWLQSWAFLLVDIPEALVAAFVGVLVCRGFESMGAGGAS